MKNLKILPCALALLVAQIASAGATLHLKGKLTSFTQSEYLIQTKESIYHVQKSAVSKADASKLERSEKDVALWIPMDAVTLIQPMPQTKVSQGK